MSEKKKILVTGGAGYIGSHTCKLLSHSGYEPVTLDNLSTGRRDFVKWGPLIIGDIGDAALVKSIIKDNKIQAVVHFAAHAYVGESVIHPRKYFDNNVTGTLKLLDGMLDAGVKKIVFSSSCATYGMPETTPIAESQNQRPINPYGESKLFIEKVLAWYQRAYGLEWLALRYFNAAGADPEGEVGEAHDPETHLIPLAIFACMGKLPQLNIFGTDYPTGDGTAVRDFIHVSDLASAHALGLDYLLKGGASVAVNLGTGRGYSVLQVVRAVEEVLQKKCPVKLMPRRDGDPAVLTAQAELAQKCLGWTPKLSEIQDVVKTACAWFLDENKARQSQRR